MEVKQLAELVFPSDASWEAPEKLGPLLRRLLRQNHFSTSRAIVGVPARWVMARLGRDPSFFKYVEGSVGDRILARVYKLPLRQARPLPE